MEKQFLTVYRENIELLNDLKDNMIQFKLKRQDYDQSCLDIMVELNEKLIEYNMLFSMLQNEED